MRREERREGDGDFGDEGAVHGLFGDEGLGAGDDEADALSSVEVGGGGEFDVERGVGAFADDAEVIAIGEEIEKLDVARYRIDGERGSLSDH